MKYEIRPQLFENGRRPQTKFMEDNLKHLKIEDDLNFLKWETTLSFFKYYENGRQHQFF
jgi:hypothetical protein